MNVRNRQSCDEWVSELHEGNSKSFKPLHEKGG